MQKAFSKIWHHLTRKPAFNFLQELNTSSEKGNINARAEKLKATVP